MSSPSRGGIDTISLPMTEDEQANCTTRIARLRKANSVLLLDLQGNGGQVDFQVGMIHTMFESLVEIGALEQDQWLAIQLIWEERFNEQLTNMKGQLREAIETARRNARLVTPGDKKPSGLILPGV